MKARISEIFKSIQGEGIYQGTPQVFVRFFGCNLKCVFCDTQLHAYEEKTIDSVLQDIESYSDYHSVSLTGGEPLLQVDFLAELTKILRQNNKITYLETNCTLYKNLEEIIDFIDIIAMDFKLPSSTGLGNFWLRHREFLKVALQKEVFVKAVIGKNTDLEDILESIVIIKEIKPDLYFILQPENPHEEILEDKLKDFHSVCSEQGINVKVMPQLHKKLGIR